MKNVLAGENMSNSRKATPSRAKGAVTEPRGYNFKDGVIFDDGVYQVEKRGDTYSALRDNQPLSGGHHDITDVLEVINSTKKNGPIYKDGRQIIETDPANVSSLMHDLQTAGLVYEGVAIVDGKAYVQVTGTGKQYAQIGWNDIYRIRDPYYAHGEPPTTPNTPERLVLPRPPGRLGKLHPPGRLGLPRPPGNSGEIKDTNPWGSGPKPPGWPGEIGDKNTNPWGDGPKPPGWPGQIKDNNPWGSGPKPPGWPGEIGGKNSNPRGNSPRPPGWPGQIK
jgi:hypothetical protein